MNMVLGPGGLYLKHMIMMMIVKVTTQLEHHSAIVVVDYSRGINYNLQSSIMIVIMFKNGHLSCCRECSVPTIDI